MELNKDSLLKILGESTDITKKDDSKSSFSEIAFNLYKEASAIAIVSSNIGYSNEKKRYFFFNLSSY